MSIDNCVSSNYLRRACADSSSVGGGGNVNKSNLCSTLNDVACDVTFSSLTVSGSSSLNNVTATGLSTLYDLTVTNDTLLNNGTFTGDIKINNLTVTGTQYIEHRKDLYIGDPLITLNSGVAGANTYDIGWIGERGSSINVGTIWDESDDEFALVTTTDDGSTDSVTISSYEKLKLGSIESTGRVGIATDTPIGDLSVSGSTYSERLFYTGQDGSWLQVGTGEQITLGALSVTTASAGTAALSYNNSNGVFSYTPPATGTMASETASDYVLGTATGSLASQTANIADYVLKTATGSMASQTATNYVLGSATGSLASQTANITDYVLKTATGSMASKTDTDYVLGTATGCAASKTCEYFTGQLFGYETGAAQTLDNGDSPVWNASTSSWSYGPGGGGAGIALTDLSVTVASAGTANLSYNNSNGVFTYTPPATGTMASQTAANYVLGSATGSMASQTATNYVLGSATGSMASKTDTDYVLGTATGCAASKSCEYFTGQLFGYQTGAAQTLDDGDSPVWDTATSSWSYGPGGGGGSPGGSTTQVQFNNAGSFGGSSDFTYTTTDSSLAITGDFTCGTGSVLTCGKIEAHRQLELGAGTVGRAYIDFKNDASDDFDIRLRQGDSSSPNTLEVFSPAGTSPTLSIGRSGTLACEGSGTFSGAAITSLPGYSDWAIFGNDSLDFSISPSATFNYAIAQNENGTTYVNSETGRTLDFRIGNGLAMSISSGRAVSIGTGITPSGTPGSLVVENDVIAFYTSDQRLKANVTPIISGISKVSNLTGVEFDWNKDSYAHLQGHDIGVIAQNIESVVPEAVSTRPDGYKAVRYDKIVPVLIEGMKEQQIQIQNLQTEVDSLKYWLESV